MAESVGIRLERIPLSHLVDTSRLSLYAQPHQLLVVLCTRADDPVCRRAEKVRVLVEEWS